MVVCINLTAFFFIYCFIPESLPKNMRKPFEWNVVNPFYHYHQGFLVVLKDPILCLLGLNTFLTQFGLSGFMGILFTQLLLGPLKYPQQLAMLVGAVGQVRKVAGCL